MVPYLWVLFFNAFVDLGHKITIQNTVFKVYDGELQIILTALVNALILIPFILLATPAGVLADRLPKRRVMRHAAAVAVGITLLITLCYYRGWFLFAFFLTLLLAIQSAFFSPAKYGYIREQVGVDGLAPANGVVQAVTIVAILFGMFFFSSLFELMLTTASPQNHSEYLQSVAPLGWVLVALAAVEWVLASRLQQRRVELEEGVEDQSEGHHSITSTLKIIRARPIIWYSVVGLSLFWGVSQVAIAAFPALAKASLGVTNTLLIQGVLAAAGIGILLGSMAVSRISRGYIESGLIPIGAVGVTLSLVAVPESGSLQSLALLFLLMGFSGGLLIVPLNALIQFHAAPSRLGQILAGNNWMQNVVMLFFLGITMGVALLEMERAVNPALLFWMVALVALIATVVALFKMPQSLIRLLVRLLFNRRYRIESIGLNHLPARGGVLLLGNHISWLDWAMLQIVSPRPIRFVMEHSIYRKPALRWFLDLFGVIPISSRQSRESLQRVGQLLRQGELVCIFPEGAISHSGQLGRFHRGFEVAAAGSEAVVVPFYIRGLWGSRFSRSGRGVRALRATGMRRRRVQLVFGAPLPDSVRAHQVRQRVFDLSIVAWQRYSQGLSPIHHGWMVRARRMGRRICLTDLATGDQLSGLRMLIAVFVLYRRIRRGSPEQNIGVLLPTTAAGLMVNLALLMAGRCVVNLNFTAGSRPLLSAVEQAGIATVYSSRRFLDKLRERGGDLSPLLSRVELVELEQLKGEITTGERLSAALLVSLLPARLLAWLFTPAVSLDDVATIIFSSGSEGEPKGVQLTHRNIMGNLKQVSEVLEPRFQRGEADVVMGTLPLFHSFGFTVTGMMPLVEGVPLVVSPDPTDVVTIARGVEQYRATIYCGTPTFLQLMTRNSRVKRGQLQSLRLVITGAERLKDEARVAFREKFGKEIIEGYGATETSPVASVNLPDRLGADGNLLQQMNRPGTVGLPLPGTSVRIVDPDTFRPRSPGEDGLILVAGVQVMKGYLDGGQAISQPFLELDGRCWYRTGDKGVIDQDGFLTIVDRYSRFAKIGGEMVSLAAVEEMADGVLSLNGIDLEVVAVAIEDPRKGERIVLLCSGEGEGWSESSLSSLLRKGIEQPLMIPFRVIQVEEIPLLGSGKRDYVGLKRLATEAAARSI